MLRLGSPLVVQPWKRFVVVHAVASDLPNSICSFFPWTKSKGDFASYLQGCFPSSPLTPILISLDRSIKPSVVSLFTYSVPYQQRRTSGTIRESFSQVAARNHGCSWCPCQTFGLSCWVSTFFYQQFIFHNSVLSAAVGVSFHMNHKYFTL
jgi:hypothetical protein